MNAIVLASAFDLDEVSEFFAPVSHGALDELTTRREAMKRDIEMVSSIIGTEKAAAVGVFMSANLDRDSHIRVADLFDGARAIKQLDSDMWRRAMDLTDVWQYMPQARRDQWNTQLRSWKDERGYKEGVKPEHDMMPFERDAVRETIRSLLSLRTQFFSEKVDGIFRGLSGEHVTNSPAGFGKRMIIANAESYQKAGLIDDLRNVIAKFRGMDEKLAISSSDVLKKAHRTRTGEWFDVDGGALRVRVYKVGTAHLEVHEDLAWKLNKVLAAMHPAAIPAQFRQRPKKRKVKDFELFDDLVPSPVRALVGAMRSFSGRSFYFDSTYNFDKATIGAAEDVLRAVGGVKAERDYQWDRWEKRKRWVWEFDYTPDDVLNEIAITGRVPNAKSHQFYPTPEKLAALAVDLADIGPDDTCLEPSAGQGGLADLLPKDRTTCVEISMLHCQILEAKDHNVVAMDFLSWTAGYQHKFDRVVMNPPFSEGRWQAHLQAAAEMVKTGGRLVAILPSGALSKVDMPGWGLSWSEVFDNEFAGASVSVVILAATRP